MPQTEVGVPYPMGATVYPHGVNFSIFSRNAANVTLELYKESKDEKPYREIPLDCNLNKTGDIWHIFVSGLSDGALYLYRISGPHIISDGTRFDEKAHLFDPYARAFSEGSVFNAIRAGGKAGPNMSLFPKCVVIGDNTFDWQGDRQIRHKMCDSVIYEAHLRGYTISPSSAVSNPGTYKGFIEKIPYLKRLGITAVEFLPLQEFDENESDNINPKTGERLKNFWGYSTIGFFAPKQSYSSDRTPGGCINEFKEMVREMHKADIEVILDVVYNHTAEGNEHGHTFEFKGIENSVYYILPQGHKEYYCNFSGCGNSINANQPVVSEFILDSLRYWVLQMHVDGFRFDLASEFSHGEDSYFCANPPLTRMISEDPLLRDTKIIAEPWDASGVYQVGSYPGGRWSEWNDRFRDDMRRFFRGDDHATTAAATRYAGSSDIYMHKCPCVSINYITAHDGFTMNDLVSYNNKHNEENAEKNVDGSDNNLSYNYGFEGECTNPAIEEKRSRQIKNFISCMMISQGVPMIVAGDEFRRTQGGNNNAYCQDNETSWVNWELSKKHSDIVRFTEKMIQLRMKHSVFRREKFFDGGSQGEAMPDIVWYDASGKIPDWERIGKFISFRLNGALTGRKGDKPDNDFYCAINMEVHDITLVLPPLTNGMKWVRVVDTSVKSPDDIMDAGSEETLASQSRYVLLSGSVVILMDKKFETGGTNAV